jgi:hypothetical protein
MNIFVPLFITAMVFSFCGVSGAREWVDFESDNLYKYAYNEGSIEQSAANTVKVWLRVESKDEQTRQRAIAQRDTKKELYKDYQGSKQLMEINCSKRTMDVLTSTDYKTNGETIWSMTFSIRDPEPIPADSRMDKLAQIVCKKK